MAKEETTTGATGDEAEGLHRLEDIVAEEVSLVDRAANKRRFLVVKRSAGAGDADARGTAGKPAPKGAGTRGRAKKPKPPWRKDDEDAVDKTRRQAKAADDEEEDDEEDEDDEEAKAQKAGRPRRADDDEDDTEKADEGGEDDEEEDDEDEDVETEKVQPEDDDEDEEDDDEAKAQPPAKKANGPGGLVLPPKLKQALLGVLAKALEGLMEVANRVKDADPADGEDEASVPSELAGDLEQIGELLEDVAERLPSAQDKTSKAGVAKAGARMARGRLDRFQKALALLSDVLKELTNADRAAQSGAGAADATQKGAPAPAMSTLVTSVNALTKMMKSQQDQLAQLRKSRATSNAIAVDGGRPRASQDVSWPLDMNRPISRDTVSKSVSFYDE